VRPRRRRRDARGATGIACDPAIVPPTMIWRKCVASCSARSYISATDTRQPHPVPHVRWQSSVDGGQ
jgi:hypothetical protein